MNIVLLEADIAESENFPVVLTARSERFIFLFQRKSD